MFYSIRKTINKIFPLFLFPLADLFCASADTGGDHLFWSLPSCENGAKDRLLAIHHVEGNGIGYNRGYSTLNVFWDMNSCKKLRIPPRFHPFLDVRGHVSNNGKMAANIGAGLRIASDPLQSIFGVNLFYDYRNLTQTSFHQMGVGIEAFYKEWDFHLNTYFPIRRNKKLYRDSFYQFSGHNALFAQKYETALKGVEISAGRQIYKHHYFDLHSKIGGYYFSGPLGKQAGGGLFRISSNLSSYFSLEGQFSYDSLFKDIYQCRVSLSLPFGCKTKPSSLNSCNWKSMQPVDRFEMIVVKKVKKKYPAIDASTGQPLYFIFVDNTHPSSDGSFRSPYPTLIEAQDQSNVGNVIYVFSGDGTSKGMDQGIILKNQQQLIGSGISSTFLTRFGMRTIPPQTTVYPTISNVFGDVVTLQANNTGNLINGFIISQPTAFFAGINGSVASDFSILNNFFSPSDVNLIVSDSRGAVNISNNQFNGNNNFTVALTVSQDAQLEINNNTFSNSLIAMELRFAGSANADFNLASNVFEDNVNRGLNILSSDAPVIRGSITDNQITTNLLEAMFIAQQNNSNMNLTLRDNVITRIDSFGSRQIEISHFGNATSTITLLNNQFYDAPEGLRIRTITNSNTVFTMDSNQFYRSGANAVILRSQNTTNFSATLQNNQFIDSGAEGVNIESTSSSFFNLIMKNNLSTTLNDSANGYLISNTSVNPLIAQSPNAQLSGLAAINSGSSATPDSPTKIGAVETSGTIQYVLP